MMYIIDFLFYLNYRFAKMHPTLNDAPIWGGSSFMSLYTSLFYCALLEWWLKINPTGLFIFIFIISDILNYLYLKYRINKILQRFDKIKWLQKWWWFILTYFLVFLFIILPIVFMIFNIAKKTNVVYAIIF